jgi:hypothetical protein
MKSCQRTPSAVHTFFPPITRLVDAMGSHDAMLFRTEFFERGRPVLLRGFIRSWPAFGRWSPADFAYRFGSAEVEAMTGIRQNQPEDTTPYRQCTCMTMADLVRAFTEDEGAGDIYLVAQNQFLRRPAFEALWQDMPLDPDWFDTKTARTHIALWMGPRGSITPFHYDLQNALLAQVFGAKSIILAPPEETEKLYCGNGGYSQVDPEHPDLETFPAFRTANLWHAMIEPGDALFLPFGWWHHVRALTDSISLTLACFAWTADVQLPATAEIELSQVSLSCPL